MLAKFPLALLAFTVTFFSFAQSPTAADLVKEGILFRDSGNTFDATNSFKKALELEPNSSAANYELGSTYYNLGLYAESEGYFRRAFANADTYETSAAIMLGNTLDLQGRQQEAIEVYEAAMAKTKAYLLYYNHAVTCYRLRDYDKAYNSVVQAFLLDGRNSNCHYLLSQIMTQKGAYLQAMLPLYVFLMMEPDSDSSYAAYESLENLMYNHLFRDPEPTPQPNAQLGVDPDFETAGRLIRMMRNSQDTALLEGKTDVEVFALENERIFKVLGELRPGKSGVWWDEYVDFLAALARSGHTEAFSCFISQSAWSDDILSQYRFIYGGAIDEMGAWMQTYKPGSGE